MTIIIKPYYSQAETPTVRPPLLYSQDDPGAQAIQGFGRGVTVLSEKLRQRLEQKKKEEEEHRKSEWTCKAAEGQAEFFKSELAKSGGQAKGAHQRGVDFHVGLMKEVQDSELAEPVKEGVLEHLGSSGRRILKNLARHEAVQHQAVKTEALQDRVKTWQTLAEAIGRDAEGAESILQDVDTYFEANRAWLNPELKAGIKGQVLPKLAETMGSPGEAMKFLEANRGLLSDKDYFPLRHKLEDRASRDEVETVSRQALLANAGDPAKAADWLAERKNLPDLDAEKKAEAAAGLRASGAREGRLKVEQETVERKKADADLLARCLTVGLTPEDVRKSPLPANFRKLWLDRLNRGEGLRAREMSGALSEADKRLELSAVGRLIYKQVNHGLSLSDLVAEMPYLTRPERERWTEKVKSQKPVPRPRYSYFNKVLEMADVSFDGNPEMLNRFAIAFYHELERREIDPRGFEALKVGREMVEEIRQAENPAGWFGQGGVLAAAVELLGTSAGKAAFTKLESAGLPLTLNNLRAAVRNGREGER